MKRSIVTIFIDSLKGKKVSKSDDKRLIGFTKDILRYGVSMIFIALLIQGLIVFNIDQRPLNNLTLYTTKFFLDSMDYESTTVEFGRYDGNDPVLIIPCASGGEYKGCTSAFCSFDAILTNECNGYIGYLTFLGFIFALPRIPFRLRLEGFVIGFTAIFWANIVRLVSIAMVMNDVSCSTFDLFHLTIWREGMILWTLLIFALWMRSLNKKGF